MILLLTAAIHFHACIYTAKRLNYIKIFDILQSKLFPSTPCANFTCKLTAFGCKREIWKNELKNCYFDVFAGLLLLQVSNAAFIGPSVKADTDRWTWTSNISHIDNRSTDTNMQCVLYAGKTRTTVSFGLLKWHWKRWSRSSVAGKKILLVEILFLFGQRYPGFFRKLLMILLSFSRGCFINCIWFLAYVTCNVSLYQLWIVWFPMMMNLASNESEIQSYEIPFQEWTKCERIHQ